MAIGNPTQKGSTVIVTTAAHTTNNSGSVTIPAASLVVVVVSLKNTTSDPGVPSAVGDGTNSYVSDLDSTFQSNAGRVTVWSFYDTAGGTRTITATFSGVNYSAISVFTMSAAATASAKDLTRATVSASSTSMLVTTVGNAAQADEVAIAVYNSGTSTAAPTTFPGSGYTQLLDNANATRSVQHFIQYKTGVTSGATVSADGTLSVAANITRGLVTYKGAGFTVIAPAGVAGAATVTCAVVRTRTLWNTIG